MKGYSGKGDWLLEFLRFLLFYSEGWCSKENSKVMGLAAQSEYGKLPGETTEKANLSSPLHGGLVPSLNLFSTQGRSQGSLESGSRE